MTLVEGFRILQKLPSESRKGNGDKVCEARLCEHMKSIWISIELVKEIFLILSEIL
jgi:hypothetical protein